MSFVKKTWVNGEVLNADDMNRLENAIDELSRDNAVASDADIDALFDGFLEDE